MLMQIRCGLKIRNPFEITTHKSTHPANTTYPMMIIHSRLMHRRQLNLQHLSLLSSIRLTCPPLFVADLHIRHKINRLANVISSPLPPTQNSPAHHHYYATPAPQSSAPAHTSPPPPTDATESPPSPAPFTRDPAPPTLHRSLTSGLPFSSTRAPSLGC
jgi:hypothetical protein